MRRGTTPTHRFGVDLDLTNATEVYLTYEQGALELEKTKDDMDITPEEVTVHLTQAETLAFIENKNIKIQFRAKFADNNAVASNIITTTIGEILKDGEI